MEKLRTTLMRLDMLRDAVYDAENLFDQIDLFQYQIQIAAKQVLKNFSSLFKRFYRLINSKLHKLIEKLQVLSFREQIYENPTGSILEDESCIYGRETDIEKLIHLLLSSSDGDSKIKMISIVGMGGIGKTTLAKHLYNDPRVKGQFELKRWVDIPTDSVHLSVFESILESISQTTNNDTTDSDTNTIYPNFLLIAGLYALGEDNYHQRSYLEKIGREIAKKCDGLPLAAVVHGTLLRISSYPNDWNQVLESKIRDTTYEVQASLKWSYNFLSDPLKQCFQYCSIFPMKSILDKKMVVQLWIAAGLLESSLSTDQEKVGEEYFDELVSRSLILRRSIGDNEGNFEMHNFIHDLATEVSSPYCINMDEHNLDDRVHTLSYNREAYDSYEKFHELCGLKGLRTFLALPLQEQLPLCLLSNKVVHDLLPTMKQLRVLSLSNYKSITKVPNSIGNLLDLSYLNLSHTMIERLSSETCKPYNLQFLLLEGCKRFTELPKDIGKLVNLYYLDVSNTPLKEMPEDMGKLVNLRHLDVSDTALREMPIQIAKLQNLQTLSDFVVSKHIDGLKLQNVNDSIEAFKANMKMKVRIDRLALEWDCGTTFLDPQNQSIVLEKLQPSTNLKRLTIKGYGGVSIPNLLGDSLYDSMVYLRISNCDNCIWLPPLGQLGNLKELNIDSMHSIKSVGIEFYGSDSSASFQPFPSLETLRFEDMPEWEEWNVIGGPTTNFPNLKRLLLSKCPKLQGDIPHKFTSLIELELRRCPLLVNLRHSYDNNNIRVIIPMSDVVNRLMTPLNSLQQLTIEDFPSLTSFPTNDLPKTLKFLIISNCENLEFLPHEYLHNYTSLEELKISYSCNSMISFTLGALPVLKSLFIEGCINLKSILVAKDVSQKSLSFLRSITIWDCNELESFSPGGLATPNLIYFAMWKCEKLPSLPKAMHTLTELREMEIDNLPNLQLFVTNDLPSSLQELTVGSFGGIMKNTRPTWKYLTRLLVLRINSDDSVNMLMGPFLTASLLTLCIYDLNDAIIDGKWFQHLNSLQKLEIVNARKLKSVPKEGLPSSLWACLFQL
ncbi:putative disease resistance RPP13-like protein 1 [Vicia villosa]|uniref:putative disease resistance RPP13-like protein 1 n=1 Tax=Vicia villosa TaxID=3911 RepID=UPI00273C4F89|nr:putative disease resistance RPP13-like protein 1 [Vicia villosa]